MKTFTVILTTVTFLVFAFIVVAIMQDEPEVIPPENLTSGISDSSSQRSTDQQREPGTAVDRHSEINQSDDNRQAGQHRRPAGSSESFRDRGNSMLTGQSAAASQTQRSTDSNRHHGNSYDQGPWSTGSVLDDRQEPEPSFTMTDTQVDDNVRSMRRQQMEILERISQ